MSGPPGLQPCRGQHFAGIQGFDFANHPRRDGPQVLAGLREAPYLRPGRAGREREAVETCAPPTRSERRPEPSPPTFLGPQRCSGATKTCGGPMQPGMRLSEILARMPPPPADEEPPTSACGAALLFGQRGQPPPAEGRHLAAAAPPPPAPPAPPPPPQQPLPRKEPASRPPEPPCPKGGAGYRNLTAGSTSQDVGAAGLDGLCRQLFGLLARRAEDPQLDQGSPRSHVQMPRQQAAGDCTSPATPQSPERLRFAGPVRPAPDASGLQPRVSPEPVWAGQPENPFGVRTRTLQALQQLTAQAGAPHVQDEWKHVDNGECTGPLRQIQEEEQTSTHCGERETPPSLEPSLEDESSDAHPGYQRSFASPPMTTLMVRNVPVMYTQELLLFEWPNSGTYDFMYLPHSCALQRNLSYAFINFTSEAAALAFKARWQKKRLAHFTSRKPLNISFADVQGLEANLMQLKKKRVRRIKVHQCQPVIFVDGERVGLAEALVYVEANAAAARKEPVSCSL